MKSLFYHSTDLKNLPSIAKWGILPGKDGFVYLCKDPLDAFEFGYEQAVFEGNEFFIVIPALLDTNYLVECQRETVFAINPFDCVKYEDIIRKNQLALSDEDIKYYSMHEFQGSMKSKTINLLIQALMKEKQ